MMGAYGCIMGTVRPHPFFFPIEEGIFEVKALTLVVRIFTTADVGAELEQI